MCVCVSAPMGDKCHWPVGITCLCAYQRVCQSEKERATPSVSEADGKSVQPKDSTDSLAK